jgi:hypothetical protein
LRGRCCGGRGFDGAFVKDDALAGIVVFFATSAEETEAFVEALGAEIVGVGPELDTVVVTCVRFGEDGFDESSADSLPPTIGEDKDHREEAETGNGGTGTVIGKTLHGEGHTDDRAMVVGDDEDGIGFSG